jgi:glucosamine--fructose-6-phosphate aminotransferase (isomerizing)
MDAYRAELMEQPAVLAATAQALVAGAAMLDDLAARVTRDRPEHVIITGMGGSLFAGRTLALRLAAAGRPVTHMETAELLHTCPALVTPRSLLIVVSQSGETIEVVRLLERLDRRTPLVTITNGGENTAARAAAYRLVTLAGAERSVSGKSYVTSLLALDALGRRLVGEPLAPERWAAPIEAVAALLAAWEAIEATLVAAVGGTTPLYLLGRGPSLASAETGALVLKEASRRPAEGMSAAQFRHGPLEMIAPGMAALLFAPSGPARPLVLRLAAELTGYGVAVVVIGPDGADLPPGMAHLSVPALDPWLAPIAEIVPVQILSHALARAAGHEPGRFDRMGKVTREE